jgi:hypothetical protein
MAAKVIAPADKVGSKLASRRARATNRKQRRAKARVKPALWRSPLMLEEVCETDPEGQEVTLYRVVDTLGRMLKAGTITEPMADAGRKFGRQFALAQFDPLRAPDIRRVPGNGREADPGDINLAAREQVDCAHRALGGHNSALGSVTWYVLGCGCSLREWTLRQGWNGRQLRPEQATGVLIAALDLLAGHYGMLPRERIQLEPHFVVDDSVHHKIQKSA